MFFTKPCVNHHVLNSDHIRFTYYTLSTGFVFEIFSREQSVLGLHVMHRELASALETPGW